MPVAVHTLIFNLTGQKSIAPPPRAMRRLETYVSSARDCGLTDGEIAEDIIRHWPSDRRDVSVLTQPDGEVWVSLTPVRGTPRDQPARRIDGGFSERTRARRRPAAGSNRTQIADTAAGR